MGWIDDGYADVDIVALVQLAAKWACLQQLGNGTNGYHLPMLRNLPQPGNPRILERHGGIQPPRHGAMNDGLLLLLQQDDDAALGPDGAIQAVGGPDEEAGDGSLFTYRWDWE